MLFGVTGKNPHEVRADVERLLGVVLDERESDFHGGVYFKGRNGMEEILIKRNLDLCDNAPAETKFPDYPVLVYVDGTSREAEIRSAFGGIHGSEFLRAG
ncbi:MAG TPA: hypothetical protein VJ724_14345 [Tahibacter sp.]|nr:hypothetical protein [Tahibacter sp.]